MSEIVSPIRQSFFNLSPFMKLLVFVLLVLLFALFTSLLALVIAVSVYHLNLAELSNIVSHPDRENIAIVKFFQIFQSVTLFIIPSVFAAWLFSFRPADYLYLNRNPSGFTLFLTALSILAAIPLLNVVTGLNARLDLPVWLDGLENKMISMEESASELTGLFLESHSTGDLLLNFLMIAILPAIGEEFLFRGLIQRLVGDWFKNQHLGIFITAFLFSFIHFQFFGFVPRFLLGLYFGYLLFWSGSIWVPVMAHLVNNGMAVLYYHFAGEPAGETSLDTLGTAENGHYLLYVSVFLTCLIIGMIYLRERQKSLTGNRNIL